MTVPPRPVEPGVDPEYEPVPARDDAHENGIVFHQAPAELPEVEDDPGLLGGLVT